MDDADYFIHSTALLKFSIQDVFILLLQ